MTPAADSAPPAEPSDSPAASPALWAGPVDRLGPADLADLSDATEGAILAGGGFGWLSPPPRNRLETYYRGVLAMPERVLFLARMDGTVVGAAQLILAPPNNEAQARMGQLAHAFIAPWARGHGLARRLTLAVAAEARARHLLALNLDVRETQTAAIQLYESLGFQRWGTNPSYAFVEGRMIAGHSFTLRLTGETAAAPDAADGEDVRHP